MSMVWCLQVKGGGLLLIRNEDDINTDKPTELREFNLNVDL